MRGGGISEEAGVSRATLELEGVTAAEGAWWESAVKFSAPKPDIIWELFDCSVELFPGVITEERRAVLTTSGTGAVSMGVCCITI